jgi:hypothetical protein
MYPPKAERRTWAVLGRSGWQAKPEETDYEIEVLPGTHSG